MPRLKVPQAGYEEKLVLADVQQKTGLAFRRLGCIDKNNPAVANAVLPVLELWIERVPELRGTIFLLFATPHAAKWANLLIRYWETERDPINSMILTSCLCETLQPTQAARVFDLVSQRPPDSNSFRLLAKLAEFASVERQVKDHLVKVLDDPNLRAAELTYISKVRDPRMTEHFKKRLNSSDKNVRLLARRVLARAQKRLRGVPYATGQPNRLHELFSTEIDIDELDSAVHDLAKRLGILPTGPLKNPTRLIEGAELDRWVVVELKGDNGMDASVWLRLEDIDTVELVATRTTESTEANEGKATLQ